MTDKIEKLKEEVEALIEQGTLLLYAMGKDLNLSEETRKRLKDLDLQLPDFRNEYETWYSESLRIVRQIIPERLEDFVKQYKDEKRKSIISNSSYAIYDYLIHVKTRFVGYGDAVPKMQNQLSILKSSRKRFASSLFDIKKLLQADLFDSELESAKELCKNKFVRAGGAVAGVVLEKHLEHVCQQHNATPQRKNHTISVLNLSLKSHNTIGRRSQIDQLGGPSVRQFCR